MPSTPYARLQLALNGGGVQTGGVTAALNDVVQLTAESTIGWGSNSAAPVARWEISSYPSGFACPAGWSTDPVSGAYFVLSNSPPPSFTVDVWGKYMFLLLVDGGVKAGVTNLSEMGDTSTAISVPSPNGLIDLGFGETNQFSATKKWTADHQANLRVLEASFAIFAGATSAAAPDTIAKRGASAESAFGFLSIGTSPYASAGLARFAKNGAIKALNNAGAGDLNIASWSAADALTFGDPTNVANAQLQAKSSGAVYILAGTGPYLQITSSVVRPQGLNLSWDAASASPTITQADLATNGATGQPLTVRPQRATGTGSTGGTLALQSASGTSGNGVIEFGADTTPLGTFTRGPGNTWLLEVDSGNSGFTVRHAGTDALSCTSSAVKLFGGDPATGDRVIAIGDCNSVPGANPSGGGILYVDAGALMYRGSGGTVTTIAPA